jgi:hypothetical protein
MNKYLVLYQSQAALSGMSVKEMFANTPPEQMAAGMAAWQAWHAKCGDAVVDLGAPLDNSTTVEAGSHSPSKSTVTGYTFLEAASMEDAVALMQGHPHFHMPGGASVQILECVPMPGM